MRFLCDSCRAQYMISDEKVGPRGVKVRCKKCGYVILVRRAEPAADKTEPPAPAPPGQDGDPREAAGASIPSGAPGILQGVADEEIGAVFDQALRPQDGPADSEGEVSSAPSPEQQTLPKQAEVASFDYELVRRAKTRPPDDQPDRPGAHQLVVVARDREHLCGFFKRAFEGNPTIQVALDRRAVDRRVHSEPRERERRQRDRRSPQPSDRQLRAIGWTIVRLRTPKS